MLASSCSISTLLSATLCTDILGFQLVGLLHCTNSAHGWLAKKQEVQRCCRFNCLSLETVLEHLDMWLQSSGVASGSGGTEKANI